LPSTRASADLEHVLNFAADRRFRIVAGGEQRGAVADLFPGEEFGGKHAFRLAGGFRSSVRWAK